MPTFTVKPSDIKNGIAQISGKEAHHLAHVLRIKKGDLLKITDGKGNLFESKINEIGQQVTMKIIRQLESTPPHPVHLFVSMLKKEKMELIVEKAVELNIESIHFIQTKHSVRTDISDSKWIRIERIAEAAQKQCGRSYPLKLNKPINWDKAVNKGMIKPLTHLMFVEQNETNTVKDIFSSFSLAPPFVIWIGPEGGWDANEIEKAKEKGFYSVSLGPLILKAETAAIHAVSTLLAVAF